MEITQREGTEQLNITADNGELGFLGISENVNSSKYIFEFDASKLNDSSNQGGDWYLVLAESSGGFLQLGVKDDGGGLVRLSTGSSSGSTDKVVSKNVPYSTLTSASSATLQWAEGEDAYAKVAGTSLSLNATRYDFDFIGVAYENPIETSSMYFDVIKKTE